MFDITGQLGRDVTDWIQPEMAFLLNHRDSHHTLNVADRGGRIYWAYSLDGRRICVRYPETRSNGPHVINITGHHVEISWGEHRRDGPARWSATQGKTSDTTRYVSNAALQQLAPWLPDWLKIKATYMLDGKEVEPIQWFEQSENGLRFL